jgi:hypothetical protein
MKSQCKTEEIKDDDDDDDYMTDQLLVTSYL